VILPIRPRGLVSRADWCTVRIMSSEQPILYVKTGCPWCHEVQTFFSAHQLDHELRNVSEDAAARDEMVTLSGQTKAPVLNWHGAVLADFGVAELAPFLREQKVTLRAAE